MNSSTAADTSQGYKNFKLLFGAMAVFLLITGLFYFALYLRYGAWQSWVGISVFAVVLLTLPVAYMILRRGKEIQMGIVLLVGAILSYGVNEFLWEGLLIYHLIGGFLLLFMLCHRFLRGRYRGWLFFMALYLALMAWANLWPPFLRVEQGAIPALQVYAIGTNLLMILVFGGITVYFSSGRRIRSRLMILFSFFVGAPLIISGSISAYQAAIVSERQAITQLEFDVTLRQVSIQNWLNGLHASLVQVLPPPNRINLVPILENGGPEPNYTIYRTELAEDLGGLVNHSPAFLRVYVMTLDGLVVFSTVPEMEGTYKVTEEFFRGALKGYVTSPVVFTLDTGQPEFQMALPIIDQVGATVGVMAADVGLAELSQLMAVSMKDSSTGETLLFNRQGLLSSPSRFEGFSVGEFYPLPLGLMTAIDEAQTETQTEIYQSYRGEEVLGAYGWLDDLQVLLVAEKSAFEARLPMLRGILLSVAVFVISLALALVAAWFVSIRIASPINRLAGTANEVTSGNLNLVAEVQQDDEIGALASAFNSMTAQLRSQLMQLEQRVAERTADLERRSVQLQVAAEIARDASRTQDFDLLIRNAVELVRQRFDFYHAGIFLIDELGEYAVLQAATGEVGQQMLAAGHKLKLGAEGMVGYAAAQGLSRIASNVRDDVAYVPNPFLPLTRSEMALPLKVGERTIGVLDVQSEREAAFTQDDLVILQTMADQLAVAIENARLLREVQSNLEQLEALYGSYSMRSWQRIVSAHNVPGYQYDAGGSVVPLGEGVAPDLTDREPAVVPLKLRGQVVGNLKVYPPEGTWSESQLFVLNALGERLSQAVESARLYEESRQRAANEQLLSAISANIRATMDVDSILQTAVREIRQAFDLQEAEIRLDVGEMGSGVQEASPEMPVAGN
ncbi:MAG: GAF domain-containing protein [Chloroflexota bacterium]